jgi:hypothetical protein
MCTARLGGTDALSNECQIRRRVTEDGTKQMDCVVAGAPERHCSTIGHLQNDGLTAELLFQLRQSPMQGHAGHLIAVFIAGSSGFLR